VCCARSGSESEGGGGAGGSLHAPWRDEEEHGDASLRPWPAHAALSAWRGAARECHLYAYAPPTRRAAAMPGARVCCNTSIQGCSLLA
jgi:hypothetical protein